jgi:hypothetical protein
MGGKDKTSGQSGGRKQQLANVSGTSKPAAGLTADNAATAGWKEVVRKSKKVSVPSNAISRVIGRGGSNINAIRYMDGWLFITFSFKFLYKWHMLDGASGRGF